MSEKSLASMVPSAMRRSLISTQFILGWASRSARMAASASGPILRDLPSKPSLEYLFSQVASVLGLRSRTVPSGIAGGFAATSRK